MYFHFHFGRLHVTVTKYVVLYTATYLQSNIRFSGKLGLPGFALIFCSRRQLLGINGTGCFYAPDVVPVIQTNTVRTVKETQSNDPKALPGPHFIFIYHQIPDSSLLTDSLMLDKAQN